MKLTSPMWQFVVFRLEGERYALHLSQVERVVSMVAVSTLAKTPAVVAGVINHRGSLPANIGETLYPSEISVQGGEMTH